jgi:hypothetical protein
LANVLIPVPRTCRDVSNDIKPIEDRTCAVGNLGDSHTRRLTAWHRPTTGEGYIIIVLLTLAKVA